MISTQFFIRGEDRELATQVRQQAQSEALLKEHILILDGAMGAMIQQRTLDDASFRRQSLAKTIEMRRDHHEGRNLCLSGQKRKPIPTATQWD